uniref:Uncharacterized protein n=1 Tax=Triticum urartu TaxID=4572 RepID=A0A8R7JZS4_TRIUA
ALDRRRVKESGPDPAACRRAYGSKPHPSQLGGACGPISIPAAVTDPGLRSRPQFLPVPPYQAGHRLLWHRLSYLAISSAGGATRFSVHMCGAIAVLDGFRTSMPCLQIASSMLRPQGNSRADRQWKLHHPAPAGSGRRRAMIHQGHRREHTGGSGARDDHHVQDTAARGHHSRPEQ